MHSWRRGAAVSVCLVGFVLAMAGCSEAPQAALGTLEWDRVSGRAVVSQPIVEIYVKEGDRLEAGQAILKLESGLQEAAVDRSRSEVLQAEWVVKERTLGFREERIAEAQAELEAARSARKTREEEYAQEQALFEQDVVSERQTDEFENLMAQSRAREKSATQRLTLLQAGFRDEQVQQAQAELQAARAQLSYQEQELARYTVTAARAGVLDSLPFKLGDKPPVQAVVSTVLAGEQPWARVYLPEQWLGRIAVGDRVDVHVDGRSAPYAGKVRYIQSQASFTPYYALAEQDRRRLTYVTEVDLVDESARSLPIGIPVRMTLVRE